MFDYSHLKPLQIKYFTIVWVNDVPTRSEAWVCDKDGNKLFPCPVGYDGDLVCWMIGQVNRD